MENLKFGMYGFDIAQQQMPFRTYRLRKIRPSGQNLIEPCYTNYGLGYNITIQELDPCNIDFFLYLYNQVGKDYQWFMMNIADREWLQDYLDEATVYVINSFDGPIGFSAVKLFEEEDSTNILYFGLMEGAIGYGIGKRFLSYTVDQAFYREQKNSVWLYTTDRDHPNALKTYLKEGFQIEDVRTEYHWAPLTTFRKDEI